MKKTQKLEIFGTKWTICYKDSIDSDDDNFVFGNTNSADKIITVATKNKDNKSLPDREIELTKMHELIHAILLEGQYNAVSDDEPLVEWLAKCLLSLKEQYGKYKN